MSSTFGISYVALWILVITLSAAVIGLYHHFGQLYLNSRQGRESQGPAVGEVLPTTHLQHPDGTSVLLPAPALPTLLVFVATSCAVCGHRRDQLERFVNEDNAVSLIAICGGETENEIREWAAAAPSVIVLSDLGMRATVSLRIGITPFTLAIDRDGVVRSKGLLNDYDALLHYANLALGESGISVAA